MSDRVITIKLDEKSYKKAVAVANIMGITREELTKKALGSFLYTVKDYLTNIEEHVFPEQIMFD